ncbi:hypothetical protein [uncultured Corynebacterium sp.]|uniref:hypothetical protein n=1 Tax=uncultured Corynebacterium sp. TaxID=159447 RepID=UPI0028EE8946|nr:hypothetical protein [uncultured Corynebacterium sp.]
MTQPPESHLPDQPNQAPAGINPYAAPPSPPAPMPQAGSPATQQPAQQPAETPGQVLPTIHRERRRPRFTTPPPPENQQAGETTILDRMSLLGGLHDDNPQPAFGRNRNIAGSLPDWSPQPPGEILINRRLP